jgi:hypothetical protein
VAAFKTDGLAQETTMQVTRTIKLLRSLGPDKMEQFLEQDPASFVGSINFTHPAVRLYYQNGGLGGGAACQIPRTPAERDAGANNGNSTAIERAATIAATSAENVARIKAGGASSAVSNLNTAAEAYKNLLENIGPNSGARATIEANAVALAAKLATELGL